MMSTRYNDPLSFMTDREIKEHEPFRRCDFCSVNVPESSIEKIDGYCLCSDCMEDYGNEPDVD